MALQDRTEPATPKKRKEARDEGRVGKSMDMNTAIALMAGLIIVRAAGPYMMQGMSEVLRESLSSLHNYEISMNRTQILLTTYGFKVLLICLPMMIGVAAVGLASNIAQVGFKVSTKSIAPKFNRLNPLSGLQRLFSGRGFIEVAKSLAKVALVGCVVYSTFKAQMMQVPNLGGLPIQSTSSILAGVGWKVMYKACAAMLVIAVIDLFYQRWSYEKGLRMTKQEVKDEYKQSEGDPMIKSRVKGRQREIARRRMMGDILTADVVITNPTHIAVAIKYDPARMSAPTVVAKGQRLLAQRIREIAQKHGVPIVENKPIARLLYKVVEVGQQIPEELYQTVAEILAFVYKMSRGRNAA